MSARNHSLLRSLVIVVVGFVIVVGVVCVVVGGGGGVGDGGDGVSVGGGNGDGPLTHSLVPHCSLRSRAPLRSFVRSLAHSVAPKLMEKRFISTN